MKYWRIFLISGLFLGCKSANLSDSTSKLDSICIPVIDSFFLKIQRGNYKVASMIYLLPMKTLI